MTLEPHRGADLIAREIGRLEVAERYRLGWGSSAERAWESAVQRSLEEAFRLERLVGPSVRRVWRRAVRAAFVRTWLRSLLGLSLMLLPLTRVGAPLQSVGGALIVLPLLRAFRRPKLSLGARSEIPSLTELAGEFGLKTEVQRHPGELKAAVLADARFSKMLEAPLNRLGPELRELMLQLQPGFPGTLSELEACALVLLHDPPVPTFSPRRVQ